MRSLQVSVRTSLFLLAGLAARPVFAEPIAFEVPAEKADVALLSFSRQAHVEVLFSYEALHGVDSSAVSGSLEPAEAIERLLAGTGFVAQRNARGRFVVVPAPKAPGSIQGKLVSVHGTPARGVHISLPSAHRIAVTDDNGAFEITGIAEGDYRLITSGAGFQSEDLASVHVDSGKVTLAPVPALKPRSEPTLLDTIFVKGANDHDPTTDGPEVDRMATGNLDLPRSENDALPYTIYNRTQIQRSGVVTLDQFLQRELLESDASTLPSDQNGAGAIYTSASDNLNLRGFGADETAILVNGRPLPQVYNALSFLGGGSKTPPPDVNVIPLSMVERVEVLPVSASALYAGNPVGGVINIVLRPNINSTEVTATYTNAVHGFDAPQDSISIVNGETLLGGRLSVRLNATFTHTVPPTEAELGHIAATNAAYPPQPTTALFRATPNVKSDNGSPLFAGSAASTTSVAPGANGAGGLAPFVSRQGVPSLGLFETPSGYSDSPLSADYAYGHRQQASSYLLSTTYDAFPWLELGVQGLYSHTVVNGGYDVFSGKLSEDAVNPMNPFGQKIDVTLNETTPLLGEDYEQAELTSASIVLSAIVRVTTNWKVTLDAQYAKSTTTYRGLAGVDASRWQGLVDQGLYNPLRDTQVYAPPKAFYDQVLEFYGVPGQFVTLGDFNTVETTARATNQAIALPLDWGTSVLNGGLDYRRDQLASYNGLLSYGDGTPVDGYTTYKGRSLAQVSGFGELQAPVIPVRIFPAWLHHVDLDIAARYTSASTSLGSSLAPTAGIKIDLAGGFSVRGSISTTNRYNSAFLSRGSTPATSAGSGTSGPPVGVDIHDPRRGNEQVPIIAQDINNPNIQLEGDVTRSAGLIYQYGKTHRFRFSEDFSDTVKSNEESYLGAQDVLNLESLYPARVVRAAPAPGDPYGVGPVTNIYTGSVNAARRHSQDWSSTLDYTWNQVLGGSLELYGRWVYIQRYDRKYTAATATIDELADPDTDNKGLLRNRLNYGISWSDEFWSFGLDGQYFGSHRLPAVEALDQGSAEVGAYRQFDGFLQADLKRWLPWKLARFGLKGQIRVNNLLNAKPPRYVDDPTGAGVEQYGDWRGRVYSLSITATY